MKDSSLAGYHVLVLKASYQDWVKLMRDRTAGLSDAERAVLAFKFGTGVCFGKLFRVWGLEFFNVCLPSGFPAKDFGRSGLA